MSQRLVAASQPGLERRHNYDNHTIVDNQVNVTASISSDEEISDFIHVTNNSNNNEESENFLNSSKVNSYCEEWERLFSPPGYLKQLRTFGLKGFLRSTRFRSVCWKLYLECLPEDKNEWLTATKISRSKYEEINSKLKNNPRMEDESLDISLNNPLSQAKESPWNRFFEDNEIKGTIKQDVTRTFPEIEFFQNAEMHDMMVNILFFYAREFPQLSYKQGMHELLAPLIFILRSDHQTYLHASENESLPEIIVELLNPAYIEHDAFAMFCQIMDTTEPWYLYKDLPCSSKPQSHHQPFSRPQDVNPSLVIVSKLTRIQDVILKKHDPDLYLYLETMEIAPQIYGIRWLRLLFGREFPLQDLLVLWDAIFADSISFDLVDYIFIAMLHYLRDVLFSSDYPTCLGYLMRYPALPDIHYLIDKALSLRDPLRYNAPPNRTYYKFQQTLNSDRMGHVTSRDHKITGDQKTGKVIAGISSLTKKIRPRPKSLIINPIKINIKANSEPTTLESHHNDSNFGEFPNPLQVSIPSPSSKFRQSFKHQASSDCAAAKIDTANFQPETMQPLKPITFKDTQNKMFSSSKSDSSGSLSRSEETLSVEDLTGNVPSKMNPSIFNRQRGNTKPKKMTKEQEEIMQDLAHMQGKINDTETMCRYCASKMDLHIDRLQESLLHQKLDNEDEMMVALAGLKQIRDILKGTLKFSQSILDAEDIIISDDHYQPDPAVQEDSDEINKRLVTSPLEEEMVITNHELISLDEKQQSEQLSTASDVSS